jgi:hypothetical protein
LAKVSNAILFGLSIFYVHSRDVPKRNLRQPECCIDISNDGARVKILLERDRETGMEALNRRVLEGRLDSLPPEEKSDITVFVSSTFTGACSGA